MLFPSVSDPTKSAPYRNLVVAKVREGLAVNKQRSHRFHMERFNLKKLNEVEVKEQFVLRSHISLELWKI
jgi:hypothetical protein